MLSNYKFSFMGNIQLQVVNEKTQELKPVSIGVFRVSVFIEIPGGDNAALLIKFHILSFMNGLNLVFQA